MTAQFGGNAKLTFAAGFLAAFTVVLAVGEAFARLSLPRDVRRQLWQDQTPERIYKPDPDIGADYRSYEDFRALHADVLRALGPLDSPQPTWLLLGSSFVHGHKHLAETAARALPNVRIFSLKRLIEMQLRAADARQLLGQGLRPQRIFFVLTPIDMTSIGKRPLSFIEVTAEGAIKTRMRWPDPPWTPLVTNSQLATIVWIRTGRSAGDPSYNRRFTATPPPRVQEDMLRILNDLGETSRRHGVPVTVVAIPEHNQVFGRRDFGWQETLKQLSARAGLDFLDPRRPFVEATDKLSLYIPDRHFSDHGNALLLQELIGHMQAMDAKTSTGR